MGLPGDPGQPMINGVVEFVGFPKGDKGMQVCWETRVIISVLFHCHKKISFKHKKVILMVATA